MKDFEFSIPTVLPRHLYRRFPSTLRRREINANTVEMPVLDEVDRMLDMGFLTSRPKRPYYRGDAFQTAV
jgi:hypothetical protein